MFKLICLGVALLAFSVAVAQPVNPTRQPDYTYTKCDDNGVCTQYQQWDYYYTSSSGNSNNNIDSNSNTNINANSDTNINTNTNTDTQTDINVDDGQQSFADSGDNWSDGQPGNKGGDKSKDKKRQGSGLELKNGNSGLDLLADIFKIPEDAVKALLGVNGRPVAVTSNKRAANGNIKVDGVVQGNAGLDVLGDVANIPGDLLKTIFLQPGRAQIVPENKENKDNKGHNKHGSHDKGHKAGGLNLQAGVDANLGVGM